MRPFGLLALAVVLVVLTLVPLLVFNAKPNREAQLEAYLKANKATPQERQAYRFALHHPEVLRSIPCFCGCSGLGHKSNLSCFVQGDPQKARKNYFDYHGMVCQMCVSIALESEKMYNKRVPLPKIRATVDAYFKQFPNLPEATPTPKPTGHGAVKRWAS